MGQNCRHFITVLGTSLYTDCVYEISKEEGAEFECRTPFVQFATLKYVMPDCGEGDRVTVFLTERAKSSNWVTRDYTEQELKKLADWNVPVLQGEKKVGLEEQLTASFGQAEIEGVRIPEGKTREELDEIFEAMYEVIKPGETVFFDFTHGLRNIPMQALVILNYAKALKDIRIGGIFYGAFELGEVREDGYKHVTVFDMSVCNSILNWTSAAEAFVKGGSSNQIHELYEEQIGRDGETRQKNTAAKRTIDSLHDLTNCLNTSRGKMDPSGKKSVRGAYNNFASYYNEMCEEKKPLSEVALQRLFEKIHEDVAIFNRNLHCDQTGTDLENTATGMAAVKWALQKGLTQQGFTALDETIKTYVCEMYGIPLEKEKTRDALVGLTLKFMGGQYYRKLRSSKELKKRNKSTEMSADGEEFREELEVQILEKMEHDRRLSQEELDTYRERVCKIIREVPMSLARLSYRVGDKRNTLSHFGFQENPASYEDLQKNLKKQYIRLEEIMGELGTYWKERES